GIRTGLRGARWTEAEGSGVIAAEAKSQETRPGAEPDVVATALASAAVERREASAPAPGALPRCIQRGQRLDASVGAPPSLVWSRAVRALLLAKLGRTGASREQMNLPDLVILRCAQARLRASSTRYGEPRRMLHRPGRRPSRRAYGAHLRVTDHKSCPQPGVPAGGAFDCA